MSLYKEKKFKLNINDRTKKILIAIVAFILVILLFYMVSAINFSFLSFNKGNISTSFSHSPYVLSQHSSLELEITVRNDSEIDARDSTILIEPVEDVFFISCPNTEPPNDLIEMPIIAQNNKRTIICNVNTIKDPMNILEGTYSFDITYTLNQIPHKHRTTLEVKK